MQSATGMPDWPRWPPDEKAMGAALLAELELGVWGGFSPTLQILEDRFAAWHGARHAIACANGTLGLELALRACHIGAGDEVVVPAFTFYSTAAAVLAVGATPVFADIDPANLCLSAAIAEAVVSDRTAAVMVVHFGGGAADMDGLLELCGRRGLQLIEDAAHAPGVRWRGRAVGTFGKAGVFSFQAMKLLTAGEGGMVVTDDDEVAARVRSYANLGRRPGSGFYEHLIPASNHRMTGLQAALVLAQMARFAERRRRREENFERLRRGLAAIGIELGAVDVRVQDHAHYVVPVELVSPPGGPGTADVAAQLQTAGVPARSPYPFPLPQAAVFAADARYSGRAFAHAERACRGSVWLDHRLLLADPPAMDFIAAAFARLRQSETCGAAGASH